MRQVAARNGDEATPKPQPRPEAEEHAHSNRTSASAKTSLYEEVFLRENHVKERAVIYISAATKRKIAQVANRLGGSTVSVTAFADNILSNHLAVFREEINRLHKQKNSKEII